MRRTLSILLVLTLVAGAALLGGCAGYSECPTICQPTGTYEYVVGESCFPIDRNGNPLYAPNP